MTRKSEVPAAIWYRASVGSLRPEPLEVIRDAGQQVVYRNGKGTSSRAAKATSTSWICETKEAAMEKLCGYWMTELTRANARAAVAQQNLDQVREAAR